MVSASPGLPVFAGGVLILESVVVLVLVGGGFGGEKASRSADTSCFADRAAVASRASMLATRQCSSLIATRWKPSG